MSPQIAENSFETLKNVEPTFQLMKQLLFVSSRNDKGTENHSSFNKYDVPGTDYDYKSVAQTPDDNFIRRTEVDPNRSITILLEPRFIRSLLSSFESCHNWRPSKGTACLRAGLLLKPRNLFYSRKTILPKPNGRPRISIVNFLHACVVH